MWTLVFLIFSGGELETTVEKTYQSMYDCFEARELMSYKKGGGEGFFPADSQAICVFRSETV